MDVGHITVDSWGQIVEQTQNVGAKHTPKIDFAKEACLTKTVIPVLVNKKDVLRGDPLIYLKKAVPKQDKEAKPIHQRELLRKMLTGKAEDS